MFGLHAKLYETNTSHHSTHTIIMVINGEGSVMLWPELTLEY